MLSLGFGMPDGRYSTSADFEKYIEKNGMGWRHVYIFDNREKGELAPIFGLKGIPFTILIGKDGTIVTVDVRGDELVQAVKDALAAPKD